MPRLRAPRRPAPAPEGHPTPATRHLLVYPPPAGQHAGVGCRSWVPVGLASIRNCLSYSLSLCLLTSTSSWQSSSPRIDASPADHRRSIRLGKHTQKAAGSLLVLQAHLPYRFHLGCLLMLLGLSKVYFLLPIRSLRSMLLLLDVGHLLGYQLCSMRRLFIQPIIFIISKTTPQVVRQKKMHPSKHIDAPITEMTETKVPTKQKVDEN